MEYKYDRLKFGKRIKELRTSKGLSQDELCDKGLEIEAGYLSKIECGKYAPSVLLLTKIIRALEVTPNEFFDCSHHIEKKELEDNLLTDYRALSFKKQQALYRFLQILKEM